MQIGTIELDIPVILAPMAGVSDYPYRQIIREMGCQLLYTEMVSSKGMVYGSEKTKQLLDFNRKGGYISIQIFGEEPEFMAEAAKIIEKDYQPDIIDINMGCPTRKIVKNGSGSALMKTPKLTENIVTAVIEAVDLPVTVKIRKGWDEDSVNAVEIGLIAQKCGAAAVAIHGRTRKQFYSGKADWESIKILKENIDIPVIGNGDIFKVKDAEKMLKITGCDGVMIARGAQGNPWLIKRTIHYFKTGKLLPEPDYVQIIEMALYHLKKSVNYFGEKKSVSMMRKHLAWYLKGIPYSTDVKRDINKITKYDKLKVLLENYQQNLQGLD
ncbi:MAG: tRNA dihydrouridine synthase DusB [Halothermotrichaceae bacterium]